MEGAYKVVDVTFNNGNLAHRQQEQNPNNNQGWFGSDRKDGS